MEPRRDRQVTPVVEFTIAINPVTKKNSQVIARNKAGRLFITQSPRYKQYEKEAADYIPELHIDYPVNVKAVYYRDSRRRVDLCNLHEALCDVLVKYGCLEDDNSKIIVSMDGSYVDYDPFLGRTEITIERIENGEDKETD